MVGIIGAMKVETDGIKQMLSDREDRVIGGIEFAIGKIGSTEIIVATCGIGKVYAAMCAQAMIISFAPEYIINVGVGGALDPSLKIADLVIADKLVQHDMDTSALGDPRGMISGVNVVYFPTDSSICDRIKKCADDLNVSCVKGIIASGDQFISGPMQKAKIRSEFGAIVCEMEGAAIAHVCYVNKIPCTVLRSISDGASENGAMDYGKFCELAAERTLKLIAKLFD